jgi:AcrR family transcriptional regulator
MTAFDFDQSVSKAHMEAAGWDLNEFEHSNPFQCHMLYVRDFRTDHSELFSVTMADFDKIRLNIPAGELSCLVAEAIKQRQEGPLSAEMRDTFLPALVGYIKNTRTYRQWRDEAKAQERLHMVINVYPENGGIVRPFAIREKGTVAAAAQVVELTSHVREIDLRNHPEWFQQESG